MKHSFILVLAISIASFSSLLGSSFHVKADPPKADPLEENQDSEILQLFDQLVFINKSIAENHADQACNDEFIALREDDSARFIEESTIYKIIIRDLLRNKKLMKALDEKKENSARSLLLKEQLKSEAGLLNREKKYVELQLQIIDLKREAKTSHGIPVYFIVRIEQLKHEADKIQLDIQERKKKRTPESSQTPIIFPGSNLVQKSLDTKSDHRKNK